MLLAPGAMPKLKDRFAWSTAHIADSKRLLTSSSDQALQLRIEIDEPKVQSSSFFPGAKRPGLLTTSVGMGLQLCPKLVQQHNPAWPTPGPGARKKQRVLILKRTQA